MRTVHTLLIVLLISTINLNAQEKVEIVLAELPKSLQKNGYLFLYKEPVRFSSKTLKNYEKYKGMKGVIVGEKVGKLSVRFYEILLDNGETIYAEIKEGEKYKIVNTYLISDFNAAKELVGKFVWANKTRYDSEDLVTEEGTIYEIYNTEKLHVLDVVPRSLPTKYMAPFYLKVKKETGEIGYISYNCVYQENPIMNDYSEEIINLIKQRKICIGMTKEQLLLSWGKPKKTNKSVGSWGVHEQWVYGNQYVYIENNIISSFQSIE